MNALCRSRAVRPSLHLYRLFSTESSSIVNIDKPQQYRDLLQNAEAGSVSYFTAAWCGPCRAIAPAMEKLSQAFPNVVDVVSGDLRGEQWVRIHTSRPSVQIAIAKLDIDKDELLEVSQENQVVSVPTFVFRRKEEVILKFSGADVKQLQAGLEMLANS